MICFHKYCGKGRSDTACTPEADLFRFREQRGFFDFITYTYGKGREQPDRNGKDSTITRRKRVNPWGGGKQDPDMCGERK